MTEFSAAQASTSREYFVQEGCINLPYTWTVGAVGSRFLTALRDEKRIWGTRCNKCSRTFVPPRKACPKCMTEPLDWIEVSHVGNLQTFAVVERAEQALHPVNAPFIYAIIKLDGADTGLVHFLGEVAPEEIACGMRVEAVFSEERKGSILDIRYFRPLER